MSRELLIVSLTLSLPLRACGFHLRGSPPIRDDARLVYLQTPNALLSDELAVYLRDSGTSVIETQEGADAILYIGKEHFTRRTLSVDPDTGKEREFELSYSVSFEFRKADGTVLVNNQTVSLVRDYLFDADRVIGKSREQEVLEREMRRAAVQQILTRLGTALAKS